MPNTEIRIVPVGGPLGADAWGVDLERLSDEEFEVLHRAWLDHDGVLRVPGQFVPAEALLSFAGRFGELDLAPTTRKGDNERYRPDLPHLVVISNIVENGKAIGGLGSYESKWHTDMSYNDVPPKASLLHAIEIPSKGGDTGYCNMYRAYEALPDATKRRIGGLTCKHDASRNSVGQVRRGFKNVYQRREEVPGAVHPIVCTHPRDGPQVPVSRSSRSGLRSAAPARRERRPARRAVGARHTGRVHLVSALAPRRHRHLGQPLHHAPPRLARPRRTPSAQPGAGQGRASRGRDSGLSAQSRPQALTSRLRSRAPAAVRGGPGVPVRPTLPTRRRESAASSRRGPCGSGSRSSRGGPLRW